MVAVSRTLSSFTGQQAVIQTSFRFLRCRASYCEHMYVCELVLVHVCVHVCVCVCVCVCVDLDLQVAPVDGVEEVPHEGQANGVCHRCR